MDLKINDKFIIIWTDYIKYKAKLRGFDIAKIEDILRYSTERYFDTTTLRSVVIGKHHNQLTAIPYQINGKEIIPITIHAITRQQIKFHINTGRFINE